MTADARRPQTQAAQEALAEIRQANVPKKHYAYSVTQVAGLLQRHGLGQTLAWLQLKGTGNSPYAYLLKQLDRWVLQATGVSAKGAMVALAARDSRYYREAAEQAWLFVRALRAACKEEP